MRISVCIPTYRLGGLDVLAWGLSQQTFTDFELVLIDGLFDRRQAVVRDGFGDAKIRVNHGPSRLRNFPLDSAANYRNAAIARATGELLVWATDYSLFHPTCLEEHWTFYEQHQRRVCLAAPHAYVWPPAFAGGLPWWAPILRKKQDARPEETYWYDEEASRGYAGEVSAGTWDAKLWSIFDPSVTLDDLRQMLDDAIFGTRNLFRLVPLPNGRHVFEGGHVKARGEFVQPDPKHQLAMQMQAGELPQAIETLEGDFIHFKNESCPRLVCIQANGFDEKYDGAHSYDDIDMGKRLCRLGVVWMPGMHPLTVINVRHYFPSMIRNQHHLAMEPYYFQVESRPNRAENPFQLQEPLLWWGV